METVTFVVLDPADNLRIQYTVKKEYVLKVGDVSKIGPLQHYQDHAIYEYLHNLEGPSIVQLDLPDDDVDKVHYFVDGEALLEEKREKFMASLSFNKTVDSIVNED